jgi:serine/threonine-protein kinase SRPK3
MPINTALGGKLYKKFFDKTHHLRRIRGLKYWPLHKVLTEKYRFKQKEAIAFADFLEPMLNWDPELRASAQTMLDHPWLKMESNQHVKMNDEEF